MSDDNPTKPPEAPGGLLSPHFSYLELTRSQVASRYGIDNTPPPEAGIRLMLLCSLTLEAIRQVLGQPVLVTSGYRSPRVNALVGGVITSQHCLGEAADFTVPGFTNAEVIRRVLAAEPLILFDQLILEFGEAGWVHVSYSSRLRRQVLSAQRVEGRTVYQPFA